jgi:uncharacterized protein (DUF433 family)
MTKKKVAGMSERLRNIEMHMVHLERMLQDAISTWQFATEKRAELPVRPWRFLVKRQHPWRKQLYIKGRNLTARQLVGSIKANGFDEKKAAENHHLPVAAIREALEYVEKNLEFLAAESEIERLMQKREGDSRVAQPVSG